MKEQQAEYYKQFQKRMQESLTAYCIRKGYASENLLKVEELEEEWPQIAHDYLADALPNFQQYPTVAIAWAAFLGMGIVSLWDADWQEAQKIENKYTHFTNPRGFDCMDEFILEECFHLTPESDSSQAIIQLYQDLADHALAILKKEQATSLGADAYWLFALTVETFYVLGISVALNLLGYHYEKITIE